jgi:hypothetical protein
MDDLLGESRKRREGEIDKGKTDPEPKDPRGLVA